MAYLYKNTLFVFGAGNDGSEQFNQTIGAPASSKNTLAIGALDDIYAKYTNYSIEWQNNTIFLVGISEIPQFYYYEHNTNDGIQIINSSAEKEYCPQLNNSNKIFIIYGEDLGIMSNELGYCLQKYQNIYLSIKIFF